MSNKPTVKDKIRFYQKINHNGPNGCWTWEASKKEDGYGRFKFNGKDHRAHRFMYELEHNHKVPKDIHVCHTCDNPSCVNPSHLFLGDNSINMRDMVSKGRNVKNIRKLTLKDAKEIKEMLEKGKTRREISEVFGINKTYVSDIKHGRRWATA
jgi:hypothetical protein